MMDTNLTRGAKFIIALVGGQIYEGILYSANNEYISLYNVSEYPAAAKTNDRTRLKFYKKELSSVAVMETKDKPIRTQVPVVPLYCEQFETLKQIARKYIYISMVDERYFDAMLDLQRSDVIAVFGIGCNAGRCETAILISAATKTRVYIFDNLISNKRVIEMGLNKILESKEVKKIFHNCSRFSDCLQHVYNIELTNVFDTEVADIMLRVENGKLPREARKLSELLRVYMKLPADILHKNDITMCTRKELLKRPLTNDHKLNLALQTVFLYYLKRILERKMLAGFYADVDYFLNMGLAGNARSTRSLPKRLQYLLDN